MVFCFPWFTDPQSSRRSTDSEVATSDFMSLEEDNCEPVKNLLDSDTQACHKRRKSRQTTKKKINPHLRELLVSQLKTCCNYHEQMSRLRSQSCALVLEGDLGYDGDSENSAEETAVHEISPNPPVRYNHKRLKWYLAHSQL